MDEETGAINVNVQFNPVYESFFNDTSFYKVLWGSAGCFHGSTLVLTNNGYKEIKDVSIGESVLSFNESTKGPEFKKVLNVFNYNSNDIGQYLITFNFETFKIICTHRHKFYYKGNWVEAHTIANLCVVNMAMPYTQSEQINGASEIDLSKIISIEVSTKPITVYDLEVEDNHNYCITKQNIIVHNSGKSHAVAQKIVMRCLQEKGHRAWAFRKVSTYVDASVYDTIREVIDNFAVTKMVKFNKTDKTIEFPYTNSIIRCAGLDDHEKIKSIREITIAWLEETTEFFEQDLNQLDIRMRGEFPYYRELIMSFNPVSEMHWIKQKYFDNPAPGVKERLFTLHTTYRDNHYLGSDYHERLEKTHAHDPNNYRVYVLGVWGKVITGMEYYKNFNYGIHVIPTEFDPNYPTHITFDFNVVPYMTCSIWQIKRYKEANTGKSIWYLRGLKEIALKHPKNSTEDTCVELLDNYTQYLESGIVLYGDASGRNRKTSSKKTDWMIIQEMLKQFVVELRVPRMNPLMETRHSFMNRMFYGSLPIVVEIDPEMKLVIEDLSHCLEDGERKKVKSVVRDPISKVKYEKFGHFSDGLDYLACEAFKIFID